MVVILAREKYIWVYMLLCLWLSFSFKWNSTVIITNHRHTHYASICSCLVGLVDWKLVISFFFLFMFSFKCAENKRIFSLLCDFPCLAGMTVGRKEFIFNRVLKCIFTHEMLEKMWRQHRHTIPSHHHHHRYYHSHNQHHDHRLVVLSFASRVVIITTYITALTNNNKHLLHYFICRVICRYFKI